MTPAAPKRNWDDSTRCWRTSPSERLAEWEQAAREDAARFWSRSAVQIADPLIEGLWYETLHARRCTTKVGKTPPGLFLPSTVLDYSHWHGDYHTNYNYQQPFYADYTANQVEMGDAYFTGMDYLLQMGRIIAEKYYGTRASSSSLPVTRSKPWTTCSARCPWAAWPT